MATPLNIHNLSQQVPTSPRTVQAVKRVELALVTFTDETNVQHCTLAVMGDKHVHLLEGRDLGFSKNTTPKGRAAQWLADAIFEKLESPAEEPKAKGKK